MLNITQIPADRVAFIDPRTGLVSREWYRFLLNLFNLTGGGSNPVSITDLMVGPTSATAESQIAEIQKAIQGLALTPPSTSMSDTLTVVLRRLQDLEVGPSLSGLVSDIANLQQQIQSLSVSPPPLPSAGGTVTSVDVSGGFTGFTFSGGPITTAGTITMAGTLVPTYGGTGASSLTGAGIVTTTDTQTITATKTFSNLNNTYVGISYTTSNGSSSNASLTENSAYAFLNGVNGVVTAFNGTGITVTQATGFRPFSDNAYTLGTSGQRWSEVYAANGTINTSDGTQKQQVRDLTDAERNVANAIKGLIRAYKFNDAVEAKGDDARIHIGVIAQDVQAAFAAEGLDATKYGLFCSDTYDTLDGKTETRLGVRYGELLAFVIGSL
jgi:hypothetical protein